MPKKSRALHAISIASPVEGSLRERADVDVAALAGTRGVVFVEYVALLLLVSVIGAAAIASLGVPLVNLFRYQQLVLSLPVP